MNPKQIVALITAGQLAVDHLKAQFEVNHTRRLYIEKIEEYEQEWGPLKVKLDRFAEEHAQVRQFTHDAFEAHRAAKRNAYNIKRRLETACRKAAS